MTWLTDMPFQHKLRFAIVATTTVAMILACGAFLALEFAGYRRNLERTVATLAQITADNSTAAIAFVDVPRAHKTLESLRAEPQIIAAALLMTDGRVIASYTTRPEMALPGIPELKSGVIRAEGFVVGVKPVIQEGRWLGTLYVWASMDQLYGRIQWFTLIVLAVLGATVVFAWFLSDILKRTIARPILELANTTGAITSGQDFSLRARQYGTDELGRLTVAFNTMLDRTQAAVVALREREEQLRIVTDNAPVLLTQCDRDYRFTFVNRPNARRFGLEPHEMIGRHIADVMGEEAFRTVRPHIDAALAGRREELEIEVPYDGLGTRWMHAIYVPDRRPDGAIAGFVGVVSDVTARKKVEQEIARARDEAVAASHAKDDFLAALSHELRTPLNPVLLIASDAAGNPELPAGVREDFETIRKHVELEARLIDDLLDLTAITRGKFSLENNRADLHEVLGDAIETVASDIEEKHIDFIMRANAVDSVVVGDSVRLQQVVWNLLKNAVKFTPDHGRIAVETTSDGERFTMRITDTGMGLTQSELSRIFESFTQGDHANDGGLHRFGGLGLGLAISRMVIELHNGSISAESAGRGEGASFMVSLPLATMKAGAGDKAGGGRVAETIENSKAHGAPVGPGVDRRILLVEDHVATRVALERLLIRRHYIVVSADSLAAARSLASTEPFEILICDVGLPDGSGYDLMRELQSRPEIKGIALTGYGMKEDLERSRKAGFSAHLTKPVRVQELDEILATVFEG